MTTSGYLTRPDYRVDLLRRRNDVTAYIGGRVVARSARTLVVDEQNHGLVVYFPRADVSMEELAPLPDHRSFCPYKGEAAYWTQAGVDSGERVAWSYEQPFDEVAPIAGYIAFYQNRVEVRIGAARDSSAANTGR